MIQFIVMVQKVTDKDKFRVKFEGKHSNKGVIVNSIPISVTAEHNVLYFHSILSSRCNRP